MLEHLEKRKAAYVHGLCIVLLRHVRGWCGRGAKPRLLKESLQVHSGTRKSDGEPPRWLRDARRLVRLLRGTILFVEGLHPGLQTRTQRLGVDALGGGRGQQAVHEGVW